MAETNTTTVPVVLQVPTSVKALIEALIFGAREPLSVRQIQVLYEDPGTSGAEPRKIDYEEIHRSVDELNAEYASSDRPYRIIQIAGGYQFATLPLYAEWLGKLYKEQTRRKLSQSSIETLAIVAYKQPITKPEIEAIRGVNCDYVLSTLLEKDLATIVGRAPTVGRPLLYGTSKEFLRHFGLNDLNDLPRPREIQEILGDSQFETERRMLEAQQGVEEKKEEDFKSRLPHIPKRKAGLDNEVKILPKKRVRDIKVVPPDEAETPKTEETVADLPVVEKELESPAMHVTDQKENEIIESQASELQEIPTIENSKEKVESIAPTTDSESPGPVKLFEMHPRPDVDPTQFEMAVEESAQIQGIDAPTSEVIKPSTQVEGSAVEAENLPEASTQQLPIVAIQVEEDSLKASEGKELQVSEEPIVQEASEQIPQVAEVIEVNVIDQIPLEVPPTTEEPDHLVTVAENQMQAEEASDDVAAPQPKTRWKSWKEKIQGFIKKLFG
jgi:segregation and condensation protein B